MTAPEDEPDGPHLADDDTPNAGSPAGVRAQQRRSKKQRDSATEFWRGVLQTPIGRAEVWNLLDTAGSFTERFACGPNGAPQPEATWFHAGEQAFGLRLYQSLLVMDIDGVKRMHDEHDPRFKARPVAPVAQPGDA